MWDIKLWYVLNWAMSLCFCLFLCNSFYFGALSEGSCSVMLAFLHPGSTLYVLKRTVSMFQGGSRRRISTPGSLFSPGQSPSGCCRVQPEQSENCSLESMGCNVLPSAEFWHDFKFSSLVVPAIESTVGLRAPDQFFLVCEWQTQQSISPSCLSNHLCQEIVFSTLQKSPGLWGPSLFPLYLFHAVDSYLSTASSLSD